VNRQPPILSQKEHDDLANHIIDAYNSTREWTMGDIVNHITERDGKTMDRGLIKHLLDQDPRVHSCRGVPMDERRLQVKAKDITACFDYLAEVPPLASAEKRRKTIRPDLRGVGRLGAHSLIPVSYHISGKSRSPQCDQLLFHWPPFIQSREDSANLPHF
jgi:hypothetical protein